MTAAGWAFLVVCWTALTVLTFWCFKLILFPESKA